MPMSTRCEARRPEEEIHGVSASWPERAGLASEPPAATSARHVTLIPSRRDLDSIRRTLQASAALSDEQRSRIVSWAGRGAFTAALGVLQALLELTPKNLSLFRLHEDLHAEFLALLERRVGGPERLLVAVRRPPELLGAPYPTIVGLAEDPIPVRRLVHVLAGDPLATFERLIRLMTFGFLEFADGSRADTAEPTASFTAHRSSTSGWRVRPPK
jgi:hypothetical protein